MRNYHDQNSYHPCRFPATHPPQLLEANAQRAAGTISDEKFNEILTDAVDQVIKRQHQIGLDVINEGEYGHITRSGVDYGSWWAYSFTRFSGLEIIDPSSPKSVGDWDPNKPVRSESGKIRLTSFGDRRDWTKFHDVYTDPEHGVYLGKKSQQFPTVTGELKYIGQDAVAKDIELLLKGLEDNGIARENGFIAAVSPGSAARVPNLYYADDDAHLQAWATALREEYRAITDAGLTVQIDAPDFAEAWDQINPEPTVADYRAWLRKRLEAVNYALEGINPDQVRFHLCWGSWHGPHTTDIAFKEIVDIALEVNARYLTFEAANVRHEHEWTVWQDVKLPDDRVILPGVVSHATNVVEHPELVAQRIRRFTDLVGRERVIASTDCGLGGRIHPSLAWAKLESLAQGAALV